MAFGVVAMVLDSVWASVCSRSGLDSVVLLGPYGSTIILLESPRCFGQHGTQVVRGYRPGDRGTVVRELRPPVDPRRGYHGSMQEECEGHAEGLEGLEG